MHSDLHFDVHRVLCKLLEVEPLQDQNKTKDWRGTTKKIFSQNPTALMVAMLLMHDYYSIYSTTSQTEVDPLKVLLRLYKIDAKAIEAKVKGEIDNKIKAVALQLKKRKAKAGKDAKTQPQTAPADDSTNVPSETPNPAADTEENVEPAKGERLRSERQGSSKKRSAKTKSAKRKAKTPTKKR